MKKRLGAIPKGLEWIAQESEIKPTISALKVSSLEVPAARRGLQEDLTRATFILREDHLEKIKAYAYWERIQIKDVLEDMCEQFFENKKIRSVPEKKR